jgi:hypothetical protein
MSVFWDNLISLKVRHQADNSPDGSRVVKH